MTIKKSNLEILALVLWCAMIFFFSSVPNLSSGLEQDFLLRKLAHVSEFSILTLLLWFVIRRRRHDQPVVLFAAFSLALDYAILDEIHQLFVFGRSGNIVDATIDGSGILLVTLILWLVQIRNKRTARKAVL